MFTKFSLTFIVLVVGHLSTSVTTGSAAPLINPITVLDSTANRELWHPQRVQPQVQRAELVARANPTSLSPKPRPTRITNRAMKYGLIPKPKSGFKNQRREFTDDNLGLDFDSHLSPNPNSDPDIDSNIDDDLETRGLRRRPPVTARGLKYAPIAKPKPRDLVEGRAFKLTGLTKGVVNLG